MAESVVSFVAEKLFNLLIEEAIFLRGVHDQLEQIQMELRYMTAFLRVAESNPTEDDRVIKMVEDVREAAYDAEDVVDAYILLMHSRQRARRGFKGFIRRYACILQECTQRHNIGMQLEAIKATLQKISEMRSRYGIPDVAASGTQERVSQADRIVQEKRAMAIRRDTNVVVGFDDEMDKIVETLLDQAKPRRCVLSIVGMGGAGKSTIARKICSRTVVMRSFDVRGLVSVSQTPNLHKIFEDIATKILGCSKEDVQKVEGEDLKEMVFTSLQGKRYLIVLDDIWNADVWSLIAPYLPEEQNGSRVMITTRSRDVAKSADPSSEPHQLRLLREDESRELFTKIVFSGPGEDAEEACTGELMDLGLKMLKNCGGLPLAIVLIGGLLSTREKLPLVWEDVLRGITWEEVHQGMLSKVSGLSYRDLPHHLKTCFLYFSLFPEDTDIEADSLIWLWVAEGLVPEQVDRQQHKKQRGTQRTMEETAEGWLEDLVCRCMVQSVERTHYGMLVRCRVHDVLRDLAVEEAEKVRFSCAWQQQAAGISATLTTSRRFTYNLQEGSTGDDAKEQTSGELRAPELRTFFGIGLDVEQGMIKSLQFIMSSKLLRVLDLEGSNCRELPEATGDLIHLRYLGLRGCVGLERIPPSVGNLQNLQTLDVSDTFLPKVPASVWAIVALRHVLIDDNIKPRISSSTTAGGGSPLVNLQTLADARAGSWIERSLATLTSLRRLSISNISLAQHRALSESLDSLVLLQDLTLSMGWSLGNWFGEEEDHVLPRKALALPNHRRLQDLTLNGRLMPVDDPTTLTDDTGSSAPTYASDEMPPNLVELKLRLSALQQDPLLLLEKLKYLKRLRLCNTYLGEEAVCSADGFRQLEQLELIEERCMRRWTVEEGGMARLKTLEIRSCEQLEMLPDGLQHLKALQTLEIEKMPEEFVSRLREEEGGEDWHKIQHIPDVKIITKQDD